MERVDGLVIMVGSMSGDTGCGIFCCQDLLELLYIIVY